MIETREIEVSSDSEIFENVAAFDFRLISS